MLGCSVKWLCGGQGASFLWASEEMLQQCQPVDVGWWSHENPFEMDIHDFRYSANAWRFMGGTPVPQPAMIASAAIRCTQAIGMETIRSHNLALKGMLREAALANGHVVNTPQGADVEGGTIAIGLRNHEAMSAKLQQAAVHHDNRPRFGMKALKPKIDDEVRRKAFNAACICIFLILCLAFEHLFRVNKGDLLSNGAQKATVVEEYDHSKGKE